MDEIECLHMANSQPLFGLVWFRGGGVGAPLFAVSAPLIVCIACACFLSLSLSLLFIILLFRFALGGATQDHSQRWRMLVEFGKGSRVVCVCVRVSTTRTSLHAH